MDEASELQFISLLNKVAAWPEVIFTISEAAILILKRLQESACGFEMSYRKPYVHCTLHFPGFSCTQWAGGQGRKSNNDREWSRSKIMMRLPEQPKSFIYFSLRPGSLKIWNQQRRFRFKKIFISWLRSFEVPRIQDEKEYILMNLLLLFSPDQLELIERNRVEQIQLHFAMLLHNYLYFKWDAYYQCCGSGLMESGSALWISKYFFSIRNRRYGIGEIINYRSRLLSVYIIWPLKKFVAKKEGNRLIL